MAVHEDGENFFSDDDLDHLPLNALAELENNAIRATQVPTQVTRLKVSPSSDYGDDFEDEDLDDAVVIDEAKSAPAIIPALHRNAQGQTVQRAQFRQQRYGTISNPNPNFANRQSLNAPTPSALHQPNRFPPRIPIPHNDSMVAQQGNQPEATDPKIESLQRQVEELLKEKNALKQDLNAKAGEISIVRSKHEKTVKEYEREMTAIRKLNEDKLAKQQKALEAARTAEKNAATERDFIKQDLAQESERVRRLNRAREADKKDGSTVTTPKKKKALAHRDGFDDDEIEILSPSKISPSKFQRRTAGSPAKPGKRKRKAVESPVAPLEVVHTEEPPAEDLQPRFPVVDEAIIERLGRQDDRLNFLGTMLDHRPSSDHLRTIEEFGKHTLPSSPRESFESIILSRIPALGLKKSVKDLPIEFCELLISMWTNCMEEKYFTPIYLFVDMLTLALELKTMSIAPHIIDNLVPLAQKTADCVAIPRFNSHVPEEIHEKNISVTACLSLLHLASLGCMSEQEHITRFWRLMRWDFVLFMLSQNQPTQDFEMMLRLLSTSVLRESFGTIQGDNTQSVQVGYILDRLTWPLCEVPCLPMKTDKLDADVLLKLRLHILQLLTGMTRSPFASLAMATHQNAIGRLVSLMSDELDVLYDYKSGHESSARIITLATRLLYHLVTKHDRIIDMQKKLIAVHGGSQKYMLCLARLNFSEDDLVLESGIDADVAACALEMLELAVTPEEGDAIHSAFSVG